MTTQRASVSPSVVAIPSRIAWSSALRLAGLEMRSRRTPSAGSSCRSSPGRRPSLLEHYEDVPFVARLTLLAEDLLDLALVLGLDGHLHLHRLEDHDRVALGDRVADLALDLPHSARDVGLDVRHAVLLVDDARECNLPGGVILAIDQGTSGTTCLVFDGEAELVGRAAREFTQHFPRPGWVEHDAAEIWEVTQAVAAEALDDAGVAAGELVAGGITTQRETVCVWDPETGAPLHRALVWQDRRTAERCEALRKAGHEE